MLHEHLGDIVQPARNLNQCRDGGADVAVLGSRLQDFLILGILVEANVRFRPEADVSDCFKPIEIEGKTCPFRLPF